MITIVIFFYKYLFNMLYEYNIVTLYVLQIAEENKFKSNTKKMLSLIVDLIDLFYVEWIYLQIGKGK